jgi:hypothetical protein
MHRGRPAKFRLAQARSRLHRRRRPVPGRRTDRRSTDRPSAPWRSAPWRTVTGAGWRAHLRAAATPRNRRRAHPRAVTGARNGRRGRAHPRRAAVPRNWRRARLRAVTVVQPVSAAARRLARGSRSAAAHGVPARRGGSVPRDGTRLRGGRFAAVHHMRPGRPPLSRNRCPGPQRHGGDTGPRPACPANRQHGGSHREGPAGHPAHQRQARGRGVTRPGLARWPRCARLPSRPGQRIRRRGGGKGQQPVDLGFRHVLGHVTHAGQAGPGMAEQVLRERGRHRPLPGTHDRGPGRAVGAVLAGDDLRRHRLPEVNPGRAEQLRHRSGCHPGDLCHRRVPEALPGRQRQCLPFRRGQAHHRAQRHPRRASRGWLLAGPGPFALTPRPRQRQKPGPQRS